MTLDQDADSPRSLLGLFRSAGPLGFSAATARRIVTLTLLAAAVGGCGPLQSSSDKALVEAAPVIDWDLLLQRANEREIREREEQLGAGPVRIAGYIVPLGELSFEQDSGQPAEFLLVPYAGACIHYPPPPADQMIHVQMPSSRVASVNLWSWEPLEVAGVLRAEPLESIYGAIGYRMAGIAIRNYGSEWEVSDEDA